MNILAIETSSAMCGVALKSFNKIRQKHQLLPQQHASVLLEWVASILSEAIISLSDLDAIAYSCGPGSFTGIRIGAAVAQGLAVAEDKPLLAIPSLQTLAQGCYREFQHTEMMIILDARMSQVYFGHYKLGKEGLMSAVQPDELSSLENLSVFGEEILIASDLAPIDQQKLGLNTHPNLKLNVFPNAIDLIAIAESKLQNGEILPLEEALPLYLRTESSWKKLKN